MPSRSFLVSVAIILKLSLVKTVIYDGGQTLVATAEGDSRAFDVKAGYTVADLGFGKGGCPIHQKGALEGAKPLICAPSGERQRGVCGLPRKLENLDTV